MTYGKGTGTPGATTVDLLEVREQRKGGLVTQRDVKETVVSKGTHGTEAGRLLATTKGTGRDEQTGVLAQEATRCPDATGAVPEGLPLRGEVTVPSGDTEENGIVRQELVGSRDGVGGLGGSMHLSENIFWEGLLDPVQRAAVRLGLFEIIYGPNTYWKISA